MVNNISSPVLSHKTKFTLKEEKVALISQGKIDQIQTLLTRANDLEKPKLKRYIPTFCTSIGTFFCGFGVTNLLSQYFGLIQTDYLSTFWFISVVSVIIIVMSLLMENIREEAYKSYTDELLQILEEIKKNAKF